MRTICTLPLVVLFFGIISCTSPIAELTAPTVERLPAYDAAFRRTAFWTGADAAYSVPLENGTILWLFGDTYIDSILNGQRKSYFFTRNSIALQTNTVPTPTNTTYYFGKDANGNRKTMFETPTAGQWLWPVHGFASGGKLYLFFHEFKVNASSGFEFTNTRLFTIINPSANPNAWIMTAQILPNSSNSTRFGNATCVVGDTAFIFGVREAGLLNRTFLVAKVPSSAVENLSKWRYWTGSTWSENFAQASGLQGQCGAEFSVSYQSTIKQYILITTKIGIGASILLYRAPTPTGPWAAPSEIYTCPEFSSTDSVTTYAAKGHPDLSGTKDIVISYVTASNKKGDAWKDARYYFPIFIRAKW